MHPMVATKDPGIILPHQVNQDYDTDRIFYRLMCIIFRINLIRVIVTKQ